MATQLPLWGKILYGTGAGGFSLIDRIMITWLYTFYITSPLEGTEALFLPFAFGMIMLLGRTVDAVADPIIARYSDNFNSKRGRRIPFMLAGGVIYVIVFIALFYPPLAEQSLYNGVYLTIMLSLYFVLFTVYVCPYLALLPELSRNNRDRVDLSTYKALFFLIGNAIALIGGGILIGQLQFHGMIWAMGLIGLVLLYMPAFIREKDYAESRPATLKLTEAVKTTFRNKPFLIYLAGNNAFWFGFNIITINIALYVTILMGMKEDDTSIFLGAALGISLLIFPLANMLAKKWGLKVMMLASMLLFSVTLPLLYFFGQPFLGLSPLVFGLLVMGLAGIPLAGLFIIPDAIVAAVSDLEEKLSGQRREAMYFGTQGFTLKINLGLSTLASGALLQLFGSPLGIQLTGPIAGLFILIGFFIFTRYPEKDLPVQGGRSAPAGEQGAARPGVS